MIARLLLLFVAFEHLGFFVLETFLWTSPRGRKIFGQTPEQAELTKVLAGNQGVYNGALAATIVWATFAGDLAAQRVLLAFVIVVGAYGAATAKKSILFVQALPAALALAASYAGI